MSREKKFTPGPWEVHNTADVITSTGEHFMVPGMSSQDIIANANLIAAAPELLEALESVLNLIDCYEMRSCPHIKEDGGCGGEDEDCDWLSNSKKAIKKAYGETE